MHSENELGATVSDRAVGQLHRVERVGKQPDAVSVRLDIQHDHARPLGQRYAARLDGHAPALVDGDPRIVMHVKPWRLGIELRRSQHPSRDAVRPQAEDSTLLNDVAFVGATGHFDP